MILQSLVKLYDALAERGTLEKPGWLPVKVSWGLELGDDGQLLRVLPLEQPDEKGKKMLPQTMNVPAQVKRASGVASNFLCDNSGYVLGVDQKGKPERTRQCFSAFRERHHLLLDSCDHPAAAALLHFLDGWQPENAPQHPALADILQEIMAGGNIVFRYQGVYLHDVPELRQAWQNAFEDDGEAEIRQCLVTGRRAPVALLHPSIKGVMGAQSSGASLVSYNAPAFESYGNNGDQGLNGPVSTQAAFAYGAALNYLLTSPQNHMRMGETTVVFWAENAEDGYAQFLMDIFDTGITDQQLMDALKAIASGMHAAWNDTTLAPDSRFCILGLAPNAARLSVRFFLCDSFGELMRNVRRHQEDLEIIKPADDSKSELSLWWLLQETVNQKSRDKTPHPQMVGDLARAILQGSMYPATLYEQVQLRIRAERKITRGRTAIIKAYLLRQPNFMHKEVLTVQLNEHTNYQPYLLGRLFAVLEALQEKANPGINATIRDKYFSSASATPAIVFPTLIRLAQAHLKKLDGGWRIHFDRQIGEILQQMETNYPTRLSLQDQGVFQLGYYHQTQQRFMKKEAKENV